MEPLLWGTLVTGIVGIVGSILAFRSSTLAERTKRLAESNANQIAGVRVQMDGWEKLSDALTEENARLTAVIADLRARLATYEGTTNEQP